jgi:hypothetical protein
MNDSVAPVRRWTEPEAGADGAAEDWAAIAARLFPEQPAAQAIAALQSWNPHVVYRPASIPLTCTDVVFIEPGASA